MAKTDRTVIVVNDQQFGMIADPNKLETMITHAYDKIDENDNELIAHKKEVNPNSEDVARDKHVSNKDLKNLQDQITTNLENLNDHKKQLDPTSDDVTRDKHVSNRDIKNIQDQINSNNTASLNRDNEHKGATVLDHPDKSVTESKLNDGSVSRRTIQPGAVGTNEIDPLILGQPKTDLAIQAKFQQIDAGLAEKTTDWINVVGLGADNTGNSDATSIIQSALNNYQVVYLPSGVYRVTSLNIPMGTTLKGDGINTIIYHVSTTQNCLKMIDGYSGSVVQDLQIANGKADLYAIQCHRPACIISNVSVRDYYGNGIDLGETTLNQAGYCTKLDHFEFIGKAVNQVSPATTSTIGININVNGGNVIIDKSNVQLAVIGVKIMSGDQVTISNSNISEITSNSFPSVSEFPKAFHVTGGKNIGINNCYIENFTLGVYVDAVDGLTVDNCFINGMSVASNGVYLNSANTKRVRIKDTKITTNYSGATSISLQDNPSGVIIENCDFDRTKFGNNQNTDFIEIGKSSVTGKFTIAGNRKNLHSWNVLNGASTGGGLTVGSKSTDKYYTDRVYTNYGINNGETPVYVLPSSASTGTILTFVKSYEYRSAGALYVKPSASEYIYPAPAINGKSKICLSGNSGSITLLKTEVGWCVISEVGTWTNEA